jgi:hypothetical protein
MMTNRFRLNLLVLVGFCSVLAQRPSKAVEPPPLNCVAGPLKQSFGHTSWDVYGCDDGHSVVVITAAGNPAMPFYFFFVWGPKGFDLHGEGTGDKTITDAAFKDLQALSEKQIVELFEEATRARQKT